MLSLRPLFFAFEDRSQIVELIAETFNRLAECLSENGMVFSAKQLWKNIDAVMTDAVTKNLKIEDSVAEKLGSHHVPLHILCKSHTCERLDADNLSTLMAIESELGLREMFEAREPDLKSFLRQKKSVVETALTVLLKLVATGGDGKTISLASEFDLILEEEGLSKSFSLYKEKRFTRLGYQAGAVLDCLPYFKKLLETTPLNNLLVRACRLNIECDFIQAGLRALANFKFNVTFPYLNFVEKTDQEELCNMLPKLYKGLCNKDTKTLKDYQVPWIHVNMACNLPSSDLDEHSLGMMCLDAAKGVKLQCEREYLLEGSDGVHATQIQKLTAEERRNLPTNNLNSERVLAKFGYLTSQSAARSNKFFKAQRIRDDMLFCSTNEDIEILTDKIFQTVKTLDGMEK